MSEFIDFLKHKYAYVALGEFKPGKFPEAQKLYEQAVSTYTSGFKGAYLLQKPGTDEGIAIILWDEIDSMEDNISEAYQAIINEMSHLFVKPPVTSFYEVNSQITAAKSN
ncbi:MAG: antibiotic biosynthesis monooxygenase [Xenococcaceae cyanobacterium MO_188.B19]|nr:antibiotic biosynthesis monooxygenase [Xenococcaceae cyanobacterium MO_188.B19]